MSLGNEIIKGIPKLPDFSDKFNTLSSEVSNKLDNLANNLNLKKLKDNVSKLAENTVNLATNSLRGIGKLLNIDSNKYKWLTSLIPTFLNNIIETTSKISPEINTNKKPEETQDNPKNEPNPRPEPIGYHDEVAQASVLYDHTQMQSIDFEKNSLTKVVLCSKTARKTGEIYGYHTYRASDAKKVGELYLELEKKGEVELVREKGSGRKSKEELGDKMIATGKQYFDLNVHSPTKNGGIHGHRTSAFLDDNDNQIYVLDSAIWWKKDGVGKKGKSSDPIPLKYYPWKINFAVPLTEELSDKALAYNNKHYK